MSTSAPATPQTDGGFWRLDHNNLSALLARHDLSWETARVYLALADLTIGYGKPRDMVSLGQIAERAGLKRQHVPRALQRLEHSGLCGSAPGRGQAIVRWTVWPAPPAPKAGTAPDTGNSSATKAGNRTAPKTATKAGTHQDTKKEDSKTLPADKPRGDNGQAAFLPTDKSPRKAKPKPETDPRVTEFINWFAGEWQRRQGQPYVIIWGKDGKAVKSLLCQLSIDDLKQAAVNMFDDRFLGGKSASIGNLIYKINQWRAGSAGGNGTAQAHGDDEPVYFRPAREVLPI